MKLALASWGLLNSFVGLCLPMMASGYGTFLLYGHFSSFPRSILEAAQVDGSSRAQTLWRVVVPAHRAPLTALAVTVFIGTWMQLWARGTLRPTTIRGSRCANSPHVL